MKFRAVAGGGRNLIKVGAVCRRVASNTYFREASLNRGAYALCTVQPLVREACGGGSGGPAPSPSACGPTAKYCNFACRRKPKPDRFGGLRAAGTLCRGWKTIRFSGVCACMCVVCDAMTANARACTCFKITIIVKYDYIMRVCAFFDAHARSAESPRRSRVCRISGVRWPRKTINNSIYMQCALCGIVAGVQVVRAHIWRVCAIDASACATRAMSAVR